MEVREKTPGQADRTWDAAAASRGKGSVAPFPGEPLPQMRPVSLVGHLDRLLHAPISAGEALDVELDPLKLDGGVVA